VSDANSPPGVVTLENQHIRIEIALLGAELARVQDRDGRDFLWNGDPTFWKGRAPLLFPMVGRAFGDHIRVNGSLYPLPQHGFARVSLFDCVEATATRCTMRLAANEQTFLAYPFAFCLLVTYQLHDSALTVSATVQNKGPSPLPCSLGFHPAFRWPLPGAGPGDTHEIVFAEPEREPIRRLTNDGLLGATSHPNPVNDRKLTLNHALFDEGAIIFDQPASRSVAYRAENGPVVEASFPDMPHLGIWTKPDAPFICIEPWQGFASPEGYDGEFSERPGVVSISPNAERVFAMTIGLRAESTSRTD
jgi:galactose mutarotase-like enzyme